jgi:hypothetical protein
MDLLDAKSGMMLPIYYKTGTHWNFFGGNIAQYKIMQNIEEQFPNKITPRLYPSSIFKQSTSTDRGLERLSGFYFSNPTTQAFYPQFDGDEHVTMESPHNKNDEVIYNDNQKLKLIIFKDSFFNVLKPYFAKKFNKITLISARANKAKLIKYIELEKPDIIVEQWGERIFPYIPKNLNEFNLN